MPEMTPDYCVQFKYLIAWCLNIPWVFWIQGPSRAFNNFETKKIIILINLKLDCFFIFYNFIEKLNLVRFDVLEAVYYLYLNIFLYKFCNEKKTIHLFSMKIFNTLKYLLPPKVKNP